MRFWRALAPLSLWLTSLGWSVQPVHALDVELDSDTSFQAYEVHAVGARAFMARRRLLSRLGLRVTQPLTEADASGRVIRVSAAVQLRLEQEFGDTCLIATELCVEATDADDPGAWQPLAADTRLDVPALWLDVTGLPYGLSARAGRQLLIDPIGFARFDGVLASIRPVSFVEGEAYAGLLVRGTSLAATPRFEMPGTIRLSSDQAVRVPWADNPAETWMVGGSLRGGYGRWLSLGVSYRRMWEGDGDVLSRAALSATTSPEDWLRVDARAVWDFLTAEPITAALNARLGDDAFHLRAGVERQVPRFDPGSIWAWFALAPITTTTVGANLRVESNLRLGANLRARHAALADNQDDLDFGFDAFLNARAARFQITTTGFVWSGSLGPLAGVSLDVRRPIVRWMSAHVRIDLWHFDDAYRPERSGPIVSEVLGVELRLRPVAVFLVEGQHAYAELQGHRFRVVAALRLESWR